MSKQIILAETMGFCWGVRRTLDIVKQANGLSSRVATIGDVIHNPQAVERLRSQGIDAVESLDEAVSEGYERVAITAHGAGPGRSERAGTMGLEVIDTTCPLVTKVQRLAEKLVRQGYFVLIYGEKAHPEARGIFAWANTSRALIAKDIDELPWSQQRDPEIEDRDLVPPRKVAILSQTTKNVDDFLKFVHEVTDLVAPYGGEVRICNTICEPTTERQNALRKLAGEVAAIIVVGGKKSSNTTRLAEVGRQLGTPSYHIERAYEIDDSWLVNVERVGVTAGASTPDDVIISVIHALQDKGYEWNESSISAFALAETPAY